MTPPPDMMCVTADAVPVRVPPEGQLEILLVRRANPPYLGRWALPGGFVELDEDLPETCARELAEETGVLPKALAQIGAWGQPGRDPRGRTVTVAYLAVIAQGAADARGADDAEEAAWHPAAELPILAFDHSEIAAAGLRKLRFLAATTALSCAFLPEVFQSEGLQHVLRAIFRPELPAVAARDLLDRLGLPGEPGAEVRYTRPSYLEELPPEV